MGTDRFSLTEGRILTFDCYIERILGDRRVCGRVGRPWGIANDTL